jgi:regulator of PEP synthase PpsR (kinase-PPPase family)
MPKVISHIFIVSDATGLTCERVTKAALAQFAGSEAELHKKQFVRTPEEVEGVLREAKKLGAVVVYTLVGYEERMRMAAKAAEIGVSAIDVLGPLLKQFAELLGGGPAEIPGLFQELIDE